MGRGVGVRLSGAREGRGDMRERCVCGEVSEAWKEGEDWRWCDGVVK